MGWTKRQYIEAAFEEIGLASYVYDLQPQQLESALRRLDAMLAEWNARGVRLGYPLPARPQDSTLDEQTTCPDAANDAIVAGLAVRIAPSYGKQVMPDTKIAAKRGLDTLMMRAAAPRPMQYPRNMPAGAGNKQWGQFWGPFLPPPEDALQVGNDGFVDYE